MTPTRPTLGQLLRYFFYLGATGFGGPVALIAYMRRHLVDERQWLSDQEFKEGVALSQLAPGPMAAQLAMFIGYLHSGVVGATLVSIIFILPAFLLVMALGAAYLHYGKMPLLEAAFVAVGAAIVAIIAKGGWNLTRKTAGCDPVLWGIAAILMGITYFGVPALPLWLLVAGLVNLLIKFPPRPNPAPALPMVLAPWMLGAPPASLATLLQMAGVFFKAGAFVFGGGLVIVPFLYGGVVEQYHWLTSQQFADAVAVAMMTPGPIVIAAAFIGFLVAGVGGSIIAAVGSFLPCYLIVVFCAPHLQRYGKMPRVAAFISGVTAGAMGALMASVIMMGQHALHDLPTIAIGVATLGLLLWRRIPEPLLLLAAGVVGAVFL